MSKGVSMPCELLRNHNAGVICDAVIGSAPIGVAICDASGQYLLVNNYLSQVLGYAQSEVVGDSFQHITHADDILSEMKMVNLLLSRKQRSFDMVKRFVGKDGQPVWCKLKATAVTDREGNVTHIVQHVTPATQKIDVPINVLMTAICDPKVKYKLMGIAAVFIFTIVVAIHHVFGMFGCNPWLRR
jgi:PAS domain S-box-containing protein